ncbi:MAG TPA: tRNA uridine-5-carboxymethylaminomethyl(34) synthesis GTPase MnmE, partial [Tenuifilum sp.]|nr:tRNA uridine-5-carboxymethylaminomethyl(34) synthesis GTPase MnmE [Tenuifilum sp.]HRS45219.1 tRNA uridine-5-carboxymethylaminomethyl(34) synthesis GTPase MnmE [Tenuifilum sp.]
MTLDTTQTIVAIATPPGMGAIAVLRLSGERSLEITSSVFRPAKKGKSLKEQKAYTIHYGSIVDGDREV